MKSCEVLNINLATDLFVEKSFFAKLYKVLNMNLTINLRDFINLKKLITLFALNNLFNLVLLLEQNNITKTWTYQIYKNTINVIYINTTNTIIMRFYYLQSIFIVACSAGIKKKFQALILKVIES